MYFKSFAVLPFVFEINGKKEIFTLLDITKNVRIRKEILDNVVSMEKYEVKEGETPEILAHKLYGNVKFHWLLLLANEILDYRDWVKTESVLLEYVREKYNTYTVKDFSFDNSMITLNISEHPIDVEDEVSISGESWLNRDFVVQSRTKNTITIAVEQVKPIRNSLTLYSKNQEYKIKHHINEEGLVVPPTGTTTPISFIDYEQEENDKKRLIKIISPNIADRIVRQLKVL